MTRSTRLASAAALLAFLLLPATARGGEVLAAQIKEGSYPMQQPFAGNSFPAAPHGPVIKVKSVDGKAYHHVEVDNPLEFHLWIKSMCSPTSLDSSVKVKVANHEETIAYGWGGSLFTSLVDGKDIELPTPYHSPAMPGGPVAACNNWLAEHYPSPASRWEPLQKGFAIRIQHAFEARLDVTCGKVIKDHDNATVSVAAWVRCLGTPLAQPPAPPPVPAGGLVGRPGPPVPPGPQILKVPFAVTEITAHLQPSHATVESQAHLTAKAVVTTNDQGMVKYRWVNNGSAGPVGSLPFAAAGAKAVQLPFTVACQSQGGLATAPGGGAIGGLAQAPPNVHNGTVRFEIVSPAGNVKRSDDLGYSVTCQPKDPTPPAGGGMVAAAPQLPDLRIRTAQVDRSRPEQVKVQVINTGKGPAGATRVRLWVTPGRNAWYAAVPAVAAGGNLWVTVVADQPVLEAAHVYLRVDDPPKVGESDEGNNGYRLK